MIEDFITCFIHTFIILIISGIIMTEIFHTIMKIIESLQEGINGNKQRIASIIEQRNIER